MEVNHTQQHLRHHPEKAAEQSRRSICIETGEVAGTALVLRACARHDLACDVMGIEVKAADMLMNPRERAEALEGSFGLL